MPDCSSVSGNVRRHFIPACTMNWQNGIKVVLILSITAFFLFEFLLYCQSSVFQEFEIALLQTHWMLLTCLAVWCVFFVFLSFSLNDLPLIGLLLIAIVAYFIGDAAASREPDAIILLAGVTLGKGTRVLLNADCGLRIGEQPSAAHFTRHSSLVTFLVGLIVLLAFSSWWHLDMSNNYYHGPRWMGLWDNPNIYGMLMGAGVPARKRVAERE